MAYTGSKAFAGRGSAIQYSTNPPSVAYTVLAEIKNVQFSGAKADLADVTNFQSGNFREFLPTLNDAGEVSISGNLIPNDTTEQAILGFFNSQTLVTFQVQLPANTAQGFATTLGTYTFKAYVVSFDYGIPVDKETTITLKLKITGSVTFATGS
jgi:predicted secreted protein